MDYSKITDKIYVGSRVANRVDLDKLQMIGVTHILNACYEYDYLHLVKNYEFTYFRNPELDDNIHPKPTEWFRKAIAFYRSSNILFCHCIEGRNRSPSLVYTMLRSDGMLPEEAENLIRSVRPIAAMEYNWDAELALKELGYEV